MSKHPEVLWAQRSNLICLTVNLSDIIESSIEYELTSASLSFKATAGAEQTKYAFDLNLFAEVDPEESSNFLTSYALFALLRKKESQSEYWLRLTKEKLPFIKVDSNNWIDEDDEVENTFDVDFSKEAGAFGGSAALVENEAPEFDFDEDPLEPAEPAK